MNGFSFAQQRYDAITRFFHWTFLLLLSVEFLIAWTMPDIHKGTLPNGLISWHLFLGTFILAMVLLRVLWRLTHAAPASLPMPHWQELAAKITHGLLYVILMVLPLMGWANASSRGWDVKLLGLMSLPALLPKGSSWGLEIGDIHQAVAIGLLVLVGLHATAAIFHHWILRDGTLARMLPARK